MNETTAHDAAAIRKTVETALGQIAPDVDAADADASANLFDEFDIDSMDFLHLVTRLSEHYRMPVPETDYPRLQSIDAIVAYITAEAAAVADGEG